MSGAPRPGRHSARRPACPWAGRLGRCAPASGRSARRGARDPFVTLGRHPTHGSRGLALSSRPVLALDLGATQVRAAVVQPDGDRRGRIAAATPVADGPAAVIGACGAALEAARAVACGELAGDRAGFGVSAPGPVDPWRGVVLDPPTLGPDFQGDRLLGPVREAVARTAFRPAGRRVRIVAALGPDVSFASAYPLGTGRDLEPRAADRVRPVAAGVAWIMTRATMTRATAGIRPGPSIRPPAQEVLDP